MDILNKHIGVFFSLDNLRKMNIHVCVVETFEMEENPIRLPALLNVSSGSKRGL